MEVSQVWQACPSANMILPNRNNSKYIAVFVYTWHVCNHLKTVVSAGILELDLLASHTKPSQNPEKGEPWLENYKSLQVAHIN